MDCCFRHESRPSTPQDVQRQRATSAPPFDARWVQKSQNTAQPCCLTWFDFWWSDLPRGCGAHFDNLWPCGWAAILSWIERLSPPTLTDVVELWVLFPPPRLPFISQQGVVGSPPPENGQVPITCEKRRVSVTKTDVCSSHSL